MPHYRPLTERYWEKVEKRGPDECWPWKAATYSDGYGCINLGRDFGRVARGAHRVAWFLATGEWPPDDREVCHTCDEPWCQNPVHHFLGTHKQNMDDRDAKGRNHVGRGDRHWQRLYPDRRMTGDRNPMRLHPELVARGEKHPGAKLTAEKVIEIRRRFSVGGVTKAQLGRDYGVNEVSISAIVIGKTWKHLLPTGT